MADVADLEEDEIDEIIELLHETITKPEARRLRREIHAVVALQAAAQQQANKNNKKPRKGAAEAKPTKSGAGRTAVTKV